MRLVMLLAIAAAALTAAENLPIQQAPAQKADRPNPVAGDARAEKAGAKLFERECSACHGANAEGQGKVPSLRQASVSGAKPGALDWVIENGVIYHGMPSFAHLPERERWQIVAFLQSLSGR